MSTQISTIYAAGRTTPQGWQYRFRKTAKTFLIYTLMILLACFFAFPLVFMGVSAIKTNETQITSDVGGWRAFVPYPLKILPPVSRLDDASAEIRDAYTGLGPQNFFDVFRRMPFGRFMLNSILVTTMTVGLGLLVNSMAAYPLARLRWKGRSTMLAAIVALIIIPFEAVAIPLMLLTTRLPRPGGGIGWHDSYIVQIIPFVADAFSIYLFYQFFIGLPKELDEAALIDGASRLRIFWHIIVPNSRPVFATVAILKFLWIWGSYLWPLMVIRLPEYRPLTVAMQEFFGQYPRLWGDTLAFATMTTLPVLVLFLAFQRWFIRSVAATGIR
ncbi:MAG: carbohydrate ABC transporter permease [Anaerolineae bacterium]